MAALSFIGAADNNRAPVVCGADGFAGVVLLLSWAAAGVNMLPDSVDVSRFWMGPGSFDDIPPSGGFFQISAADLTELVRAVGECAGVSCKGLSPGSLPVYLSQLRNGFRANHSAQRPAVPSSYSRNQQALIVRAMAFDPADLAITPTWVRSMVQG